MNTSFFGEEIMPLRSLVIAFACLLTAVGVLGCGGGGGTDGDTGNDGDTSVDGDTLPDGDTGTDGDTASDGDTLTDGDMVADGDTSVDGDIPADGDTQIDGDAADGDTGPDGDTAVDGDIPVDGDTATDGDEEQPDPCRSIPVGVGDPEVDDDQDGLSENQGDCDDGTDKANLGLPEVFDALDNNCDGTIDEGFDDDCDGFQADRLPDGNDCNDADRLVNPAAADDDRDRVDENCDGSFGDADSGDDDGDGFAKLGTGGTEIDCDDADRFAFPGAAGIDDPDACLRDRDDDGYGAMARAVGSGTDCDDQDPGSHPGAVDTPGDGTDQDCVAGDLDPLATAGGFVFVDPAGGLDTNNGTSGAPKQTIGSALIVAAAADRDLILAGGDYREAVSLTGDIWLFGGYAPDTWQRDPATHPTRLLRSGYAEPVVTVASGSAGIDGVEMENGEVVPASANQFFTVVEIAQGSRLTLRRSKVHGGSSGAPDIWSYQTAVKINYGATVVIEECEIHAGSCVHGTTIGIVVGALGYEGTNTVLRLNRSFVNGGSSNINPQAIVVGGQAEAILVGNYIDAGRGSQASADAWAVNLASPSTVVMVNNTVYGGTATGWGRTAAVNNSSQSGSAGADLTLINNILEGGRSYSPRGVVSHSASRIRLLNNDLHVDPDASEECAFGRWMPGGGDPVCLNDPAAINDCSRWTGAQNCFAAAGNIVDPPLVTDFQNDDWHLQPGSPAIDAGIDPSGYGTGGAHVRDLDGAWRLDGPIDLGADEWSAR